MQRRAASNVRVVLGSPRGHRIAMSQLLRFPSAVRHDPQIDAWMHEHAGELGAIAERWFQIMRGCGEDVRELLHDGHPTACVKKEGSS